MVAVRISSQRTRGASVHTAKNCRNERDWPTNVSAHTRGRTHVDRKPAAPNSVERSSEQVALTHVSPSGVIVLRRDFVCVSVCMRVVFACWCRFVFFFFFFLEKEDAMRFWAGWGFRGVPSPFFQKTPPGGGGGGDDGGGDGGDGDDDGRKPPASPPPPQRGQG